MPAALSSGHRMTKGAEPATVGRRSDADWRMDRNHPTMTGGRWPSQGHRRLPGGGIPTDPDDCYFTAATAAAQGRAQQARPEHECHGTWPPSWSDGGAIGPATLLAGLEQCGQHCDYIYNVLAGVDPRSVPCRPAGQTVVSTV